MRAVKAQQHARHTDPWNINIPEEHLSQYFYNQDKLSRRCEEWQNCPYKPYTKNTECWGYEGSCVPDYNYADCLELQPNVNDSRRIQRARKHFYEAADWGYVKQEIDSMKSFCTPQHTTDSALRCSSNMHYCEAENIYINFEMLGKDPPEGEPHYYFRHRQIDFSRGRMGGHCKLDRPGLLNQKHHSQCSLSSWYPTIKYYDELDFRPSASNHCDIVEDKLTFLIKLDIGANLYHHFCDFFNIYLSQHIGRHNFTDDIKIISWDSPSGCSGSRMFAAFNQHLLHRLEIQQYGPMDGQVRVTLIARTTATRTILNQRELVDAMKTVPAVHLSVYDLNTKKISFRDQINITHNTDIIVGMHGAGLTHMLFQPDWGVTFEMYNCEDGCYSDLARLRGIKHLTWRRPYKLWKEATTQNDHIKDYSYGFDVEEFMKILMLGIDYVEKNTNFQNARTVG
ncbi:PREDICTED: EGF domain-specific O-linked N-acetylglucosamine transferase-like [Priapulus caudatus]|uniref:EGF domain-specific O-linked N-acetylglucosamine transferase n=1 Tax=Priapulus caudatus TaxID=37621 RepID=A0ABM1DRD8_PRICU|nr:PREDICTED: EGF domain-specific O-linked N-acetylglucosamine transferase-like [Priapulus caudatus]